MLIGRIEHTNRSYLSIFVECYIEFVRRGLAIYIHTYMSGNITISALAAIANGYIKLFSRIYLEQVINDVQFKQIVPIWF